MLVKIRVYNPYDLDIIALCETRGFSVPEAMRQTLIYYARGMRYRVEIPVLPEGISVEKYVRAFQIELDNEKDSQAIEFLKRVPEGNRNAFMKNIFRASFEVSPFALYMEEGGSELVQGMIEMPRCGRYPVQREFIDEATLSGNEIGVTVAPDSGHEPALPGVKASDIPAKTPAEKLAARTKKAFGVKEQQDREYEKRRKEILAAQKKTQADTNSDELDELLGNMM